MPSPDGIRLRHMQEATVAALEMTAGRTRSDLDENLMFRMALTRCLEVLGEAASKVSAETRVRFPSIPFSKIVSMRNHLIHAYFDVDLSIVWTTVEKDLAGLLPAVESALVEIDR